MTVAQIAQLEKSFAKSKELVDPQSVDELFKGIKFNGYNKDVVEVVRRIVKRICEASYKARLTECTRSLSREVEEALAGDYNKDGEDINQIHGQYNASYSSDGFAAVSYMSDGEIEAAIDEYEQKKMDDYVDGQTDYSKAFAHLVSASPWKQSQLALEKAVAVANSSPLFKYLDVRILLDSDNLILSIDTEDFSAELRELLD